ncbi:hypothetical protein HO133_007527 [Letharia lupina]|uniref:Uncharacterized protein n=1 Tax=Letharia lupina TaxID=560253 RepID=A0A8H6KYY9_9LECA|nr:uncharacterized protein HO133_007527 [Letharia lupina]KAF6229411.1 hypothetical protein HO133_007527 [Letharia lupina]
MPTLATPNPPSRNPSAKKRKYDQLDPPPPPLPPNGFVLYIALDALPPAKRRCGVLDYRWTLLLAPEDKPETHGRQYLIREISPKIDPRDGPGSSKGLGIPGRGFEEPGLEQQRRRVERFLASTPSEDTDHGNSRSRTSACNHPERHESGYSCRGSRTRVDWNPVRWMGVAWTALAEAGDVLGVGGLKSEPVGWETVQKTVMEFVTA